MSTLQYISQQSSGATHLQNITAACEAGCRWIQLRLKGAPEAAILETAHAARLVCDRYGAVLIVNDHPHIAKAAGAHGVHVGKNDMTVAAARQLLGEGYIVGGTANTLHDILQHVQEGASYIGLGPYRFTTTKQKLSPILGLQGIAAIMQELRERHIAVPVVAIGGILLEDVPALMRAGVQGVAVSGLITREADKAGMVQAIFRSQSATGHALPALPGIHG